jgi:hypothetical protein
MSTLNTFLYAFTLNKRGHIFKRFKIWVMSREICAEFGRVPIWVFVIIFIGCALFTMGLCAAVTRLIN